MFGPSASGDSIIPVPFQSVYNASKAALSIISGTTRLELEAFNIKVVELKIGLGRTKFSTNVNESRKPDLCDGSIYEPARESTVKILRSEAFDGNGTDPHVRAKSVVNNILKKSPPMYVYRGESAWYARVIHMAPAGMLNGAIKKAIGLDVVEQVLKKQKRTWPKIFHERLTCSRTISELSMQIYRVQSGQTRLENISQWATSPRIASVRHAVRGFHQIVVLAPRETTGPSRSELFSSFHSSLQFQW